VAGIEEEAGAVRHLWPEQKLEEVEESDATAEAIEAAVEIGAVTTGVELRAEEFGCRRLTGGEDRGIGRSL
jgi:hypothetical protein